MNPIHLALSVLVLAAAVIAVYGPTFRVRLISVWVAALMLGLLFLFLKNELLAMTLVFMSTITTWVFIAQTLVFGDFQQPRQPRENWRNLILPVAGSLMILAILHLAVPDAVRTPEVTEPIHVVLAEFGAQLLSRYFLLAVVVCAVSFAAVVGVGMIARAEWKRDGGQR